MDNFPVADIVEESICTNVNAFVGNRDINLNTIVKMTMLNEIMELDQDKMKTVTEKMYKNNQMEHYFINMEYELTMDNSGNLVYIDEEKNKKDTGSILPESE